MRRHFEAAELDQAQPPGRAVGRIKLVDADFGAVRVAGHVGQQIAEDAVDQPGRDIARRAVGHFAEGDFQFVERVVARFVDARRLAGRADEQAREQIGQRRDGSANRRSGSCSRSGRRRNGLSAGVRAADHDMIAAAGAGMPPVEHEFLGAQPARRASS